MRLFFLPLLVTAFLTALFPLCSWAESQNGQYDSNLCNSHFAHYEKAFDIPSNMLRAVSIVEAGLITQKGQSASPWPWTFNAQGKGYFFKTKQEAIAAVRALQRSGQSSIDVGCMQINLYYHPDAFHSLEEAFDPKSNIAYGASFLKNNYNKSNDWRKAIASYHSETASLGYPYAQKVLAVWRKAPMEDGTSYASLEGRGLFSNSSSFYRNASFSSRTRERRMSNMMIKVYRSPSPVYAKYNAEKVAMVENITQNALHNFNKGKQLKPVTFID